MAHLLWRWGSDDSFPDVVEMTQRECVRHHRVPTSEDMGHPISRLNLNDLRLRIGPLLDLTDEFNLFPVDERGDSNPRQLATPPDRWGPVLLV